MFESLVYLLLINTAFSFKLSISNSVRDDRPTTDLCIIGGENTTIEAHPYQVSITLPALFISGAILNKYWVITTASKLSKKNIDKSIKIRVGSNHTDEGGKVYAVEETIVHPKFDNKALAYDIALHRLSTPLSYGPAVKSIELGKKKLRKDQKVVVSGWGADHCMNGHPYKQITLKIEDYAKCSSDYIDTDFSVDKSTICGYAKKSHSGPYYDYGAPLVRKNKLYGLYSWGVLDYPSVYASLQSAQDWIENIIKE